MHRIDVSHLKLSLWFVFLVLLIQSNAIRAEWIEARLNTGNNNIWINTNRDAIYVGQDCKPLMNLKHLRGRKPRSLEERQQAFNTAANAPEQIDTADTNTLTSNKSDAPAASVAILNPDPLDLNYQTQPKYDPLNRNTFNILIDNASITLISQYGRVKATIIGRYESRSSCN